MAVACPEVVDLAARLRLTVGGKGTWFYRDQRPIITGEMLDTFVNDGFATVEVKWEEPVMDGGRTRTLAFHYATVACWVYDNLDEGGEETLFVA